jgi:hypothetical protein
MISKLFDQILKFFDNVTALLKYNRKNEKIMFVWLKIPIPKSVEIPLLLLQNEIHVKKNIELWCSYDLDALIRKNNMEKRILVYPQRNIGETEEAFLAKQWKDPRIEFN